MFKKIAVSFVAVIAMSSFASPAFAGPPETSTNMVTGDQDTTVGNMSAQDQLGGADWTGSCFGAEVTVWIAPGEKPVRYHLNHWGRNTCPTAP